MADFGAFLQSFVGGIQQAQEQKSKRDFMVSQKKLIDMQIKVQDAEAEMDRQLMGQWEQYLNKKSPETPTTPTQPGPEGWGGTPAQSGPAGWDIPMRLPEQQPDTAQASPQQGIPDMASNLLLRGWAKKKFGIDPGEINYKGGLAGEGGKPTMKGFDITGREIPGLAQPEAEKPETAMQKFNQAAKLRGEFTDINKIFRDARDSFGKIQQSAINPTAAGDFSMIYNYVKMLDPGVVKEGEFGMVAGAGAYGDTIAGAVNRIVNGKRLSDNVRNDFIDRSNMLYDQAKAQYDQTISEYTRLAKQIGIDPKEVIMDFGLASTKKSGLGKQPPKLGGKGKAKKMTPEEEAASYLSGQ